MVRTALAWAGATAVLLPVLSGCSGTPHRSAVTAAARAFVQHVRAGEGDAACALLTDDARSSVPGATDQTCAKAITNVKEQGSGVGRVAVWGDAAQVRIGTDVVFLRRMAGHWLVSAAGCKPQPDGPYDCEVGG
jgi:hypothetical protein